jgi:xanthine/uracil/vitamin C permease (AzgA family)
LSDRKSRLSTELRAGIVTFLTAWCVWLGANEDGYRVPPAAPWGSARAWRVAIFIPLVTPLSHPLPTTTKPPLTTTTPHPSTTKQTNSYILAVNSAILADTGGPCSDNDCTGPNKGPGCRFLNDPGYDACLVATRKSLVTATAATAAMASFLMGAIANVPFAIMPGMGVNA